jgi:hypothetical protein
MVHYLSIYFFFCFFLSFFGFCLWIVFFSSAEFIFFNLFFLFNVEKKPACSTVQIIIYLFSYFLIFFFVYVSEEMLSKINIRI